MRTLLSALVVLTFGCGPDEMLDSAPQTATAAIEDKASDTFPETPMRWEVVNTEQGLVFRIVQDPVEEHFFFPVDVTQPPPGMPQPPCPACR